MRLTQIGPAAKVRQLLLFQQRQGFGKRRFAVVARVVIGQRHRIDMALEHWQHPGVGAEGVNLAVQRLAGGGHRAFQIANGVIAVGQQAGKRGKWVAARCDHLAGAVIEHDIAHHQEAHLAGIGLGQRSRQAKSGQQQAMEQSGHRRSHQ